MSSVDMVYMFFCMSVLIHGVFSVETSAVAIKEWKYIFSVEGNQ